MLKITNTYGEVHTCKVRACTLTNILHFKSFSLEIPKIGKRKFSKTGLQNKIFLRKTFKDKDWCFI